MRSKYSEILKQNISIDDAKGIITTEDDTVYNKKELLLLKDCSDNLKYNAHQVKKEFNGEIIK
jgi:hypothetical protein